jgi:tetratricopeptide (TPR) repeat protein
MADNANQWWLNHTPEDLLVLVGEHHEYRKSTETAKAFFSAAIRVGGSSKAFYRLGKLLLESGSPKEAVSPLLAASELLPDHAATRYLLARAYKESGQTQSALREMEVILAAHPDHPGAITLVFDCYIGLGELSRAARWWTDHPNVLYVSRSSRTSAAAIFEALADHARSDELLGSLNGTEKKRAHRLAESLIGLAN